MEKESIRNLRNSMNMTQKEFAEFCGVGERTVQKWEAGSNIPPLVSKFLEYVEGEFNSGSVIKNNGDNSIVGTGIIGNQINSLDGLLKQALDEVSEQRKIVNKSQEQIDRLITLLEKK